MITIYSEKGAFEKIALYNEDYPNWFQIFSNHANVCLNISKADYEMERMENPIFQEFIKINSGREPSPLSYQFDNINDNYSIIANEPRAVYFLDISDEKATELQDLYGVIVQTENRIDDNILKGTYYRNLRKNSVWDFNSKIGWNSLLNISFPPQNAIVISDNYLFSNEFGNRGVINLIKFIEAILPPKLESDFHILLIAQEYKNDDKAHCERKVADIKEGIVNLRKSYNIIFELVFAETIHKRIAISNYFTITPDKGFAIFKTNDPRTVHEDTEIQIDRVFNRLNIFEGDTEFENAEQSLKDIKKICEDVAEIISRSPNMKNYKVLGDCNRDNSLNNRLLNDV